jgi:tetratricopeptide (TPR) repeat protein
MDQPVTLVTESGNLCVDVDRSRVDYYSFQSLVAQARELRRRGQLREAMAVARRALDLWRGQPLDELRTERAENWRRRVWTDDWLPANALLVETMLELGEYDEAMARMNDVATQQPNDLTMAKLRLTALRGLTRNNDATAYYFATRKRLLEDGDEQAAGHLMTFYEDLVGDRTPSRPGPIVAESPAVPRQLPHDVVYFVGRGRLLDALDAACTTRTGEPRSGVVILSGMAGIGKTALAVHWGHRARNRFPGGDLYVDLNGFSDGPPVSASTVIDAFLAGLGQTLDGRTCAQARAARLRTALVGRRTLVLLDNARDLQQIGDLIPLLTDSLVLVTSRGGMARLATWKGAQRLRVEPLSLSESATLLSGRLGLRGPPAEHDLATLAALCGGHPLAINLVADHATGRTGATMPELGEQLRRDGFLLTIGDDGDAAASLQALFSYSHHALAPPERRLFDLLGCHPGLDISHAAAAALDGRTPADTRRSLDVLVSAHLLEQPAIDRYRSHDLIRDYVRHVALPGHPPTGRITAEKRLLSFYLATAYNAEAQLFPSHTAPTPMATEDNVTPATFSEDEEAMAWCLEEMSNLDAAIHYAASRSHHGYAWRLPQALSAIYERLGFYVRSRAIQMIGVASALADGDAVSEGALWQELGLVNIRLGDYSTARECLHHALSIATNGDHDGNRAYALHTFGQLEVLEGNVERGIELYRECLDIARRISNMDIETWTHYRLGEALRDQDHYEQALLSLYQALWLTDASTHDASLRAHILISLGALFADRNDHAAAEAHCRQALKVIVEIRYTMGGASVCYVLARINKDRGYLRDARGYARRSVALYRQIHHSEDEAKALELLGDIVFVLGDVEAAKEGWEQAVSLFQELNRFSQIELIHRKMTGLST